MRKQLFAAAAAAVIMAMAGSAMAQSRDARARTVEQQKTDQLAALIQAQITALGPMASATDIQNAINSAVVASGDTPTEAYAAIEAVAANNVNSPNSAVIQTAANVSATIVLQSAGNAQAQAQVRTQAAALTTQATVQLASATNGSSNGSAITAQTPTTTNNNTQLAQNTNNNVGSNAVASNGATGLGTTGGLGTIGGAPTATAGLGGSSYR